MLPYGVAKSKRHGLERHTKSRGTDKGPSLQNNLWYGFCKARNFREYQKQKCDLSVEERCQTTTFAFGLTAQTYPLRLMLHSDLKELIPGFDSHFLIVLLFWNF